MGFAKNQNTRAHYAKDNANRSAKIHLAVDSNGYPVHFELSGGHRNDIVFAEQPVVSNSPASEFTVADKGYDSKKFKSYLKNEMDSIPMIHRENLILKVTMRWIGNYVKSAI